MLKKPNKEFFTSEGFLYSLSMGLLYAMIFALIFGCKIDFGTNEAKICLAMILAFVPILTLALGYLLIWTLSLFSILAGLIYCFLQLF